LLTSLLAALAGGAPDALAEFKTRPITEQLALLANDAALLTPEQRTALGDGLEAQFREAAREGMTAYIDYLDLGFRPVLHQSFLIAHGLEPVERGECDRLMVLMPPGSAKSTYTSVVFPPWYLGRNPERSVIAASHTQDLTERFGRRARNLYASSAHYNVFGHTVAADSKAAAHWNTDCGGEYFAAGVGGAIAGHRADLGLIDDPVRSREDADSDRSRERAWEWYINDFLPRLKPGAAQILVMTRWHDDDLGGRILEMERDRWRVIKLPMIAGNNDLLGRAAGERLWPEWYTAGMVEDARRDVRVWNALYQQEPAGEDGDYFKRDWFHDTTELPLKLSIYGASDYAVTEGGGDYTEHGIFGVDAWSNLYLLDWWRGQTASDVWIEAECDLIARYEPLCWFGESGAIRRAIEPFLLRRMEERRVFCRLEWLPSIHDKPTRCRPFQAMAANGKVFVPRLASWKADVLGQLLRFPAGAHDDSVDVCSLIGRGLAVIRAPEIMETGMQVYANRGYEHAKERRGRGR
jgi:predicted phage terminase large subunit-like protein